MQYSSFTDVIVPTFEENRTFMLGVASLFSQFSAIKLIFFHKKLLCLIEDTDPLNQHEKDILPPIMFAKVRDFENWQFCHALELSALCGIIENVNYAHLENFICSPSSVTRKSYAFRFIQHTKIVPN